MDAQRKKSRSRRSWRWIAAFAVFNAIVLGYFLAPQTASEQIRRQLLSKLRAHYPHLTVAIASARIGQDGVVILEGIEFTTIPQRRDQRSLPVLKVSRVEVHSDLALDQLWDHKSPLRPRKVVATDVVADLWQSDQGRWSLELLWPPLKVNDGCPQLEIRGGRLRIHRDQRMEVRPLEIDQIGATIDLAKCVDPKAFGQPTLLAEAANSASMRFSIRAAAAFIESLQLTGEVSGGRFHVGGDARGVRLDPALASHLPLQLAARWEDLTRLSLLMDLRYDVQGPLLGPGGSAPWWRLAGRPTESADGRVAEGRAEATLAALIPTSDTLFAVDALVRDGRFDHPMLPQPLEQIRGQFSLHDSGMEVLQAEARLGDAAVQLSGAIDAWSADATWSGKLTANGLMINEALASQIPGRVGVIWDEFRPAGPIDVNLNWTRASGRWSSHGIAELRGVDIQMGKFPYPVSQLKGRIEFDPLGARSHGLSGQVSGQTLSVAFEQFTGPRAASNWLQLAVDGPVPIDAPLIAALTPRGQPLSGLEQFVRSLSPSGQVHLVAARWDREIDGKPRKSIDLKVSGGMLRYQKFPYPLYDVRGTIAVQDDWTRLIGFQASNSDNARIVCEGNYLKLPEKASHATDGDWQLALRFQARELPLDEALRAALNTDSRAIWDNLSPTGVLDHAEVTIHHAEKWPEPKIVIAAKQDTKPTIDNRTISLRATDIPYRIDLVEGAMRYDGDLVWIDSLDGRHDSTRISADGRCQRTESGRWRMDLNVHSGSRLHPDAELIGSLPTQIRGAFQRLQFRGPLSARGQFGFWLPDALHPTPAFDWDMVFQLEGNRIGDVGPVRDLRGEITMKGKQDASTYFADGEVSIDSMHFASQQITMIRGPYAVQDGRLLLGDAIPQPTVSPQAPPASLNAIRGRPIEGRIYGGTASISGEMLLNDGAFDVVLAIANADMPTMLLELGQADNTVRGKVQGQVRLEGVVGASHLLKGAGSATLSEANLYQLPLLISVFNMLRIKPSESVAFTDGSVRFTVYGDHVTFNELKLWGDLIALDGTGTMNRAQEVDLSFNTRVSPHNVWSYVASPFGEDRYTLWTLNVRGPLANPHIDRRGIDAMNGTLERLIPGMVGPETLPSEAAQWPRLRDIWTR